MTHQTYEWKTKNGSAIFGQSWVPDSSPRALICHIHGQSDHSTRFAHVADFFVSNNIAFFTLDLIGHGRSAGKRGHVTKFNEYLENVELLKDEAVKLFPNTPLFIYGHSMGGNIAINHAFYTKDKVKGYIITSPWIRLAFEPPAWKVMLGKMVRSVYPTMLQPTGININKISHDTEVVKKYGADELVHGKISASAYFEILDYGYAILEHAKRLNYPMLLLHGTGDALTSHLASREFADMRKDLITYKEFDGLYHEMHNEPEKQQIFDRILQWIEEQLKQNN